MPTQIMPFRMGLASADNFSFTLKMSLALGRAHKEMIWDGACLFAPVTVIIFKILKGIFTRPPRRLTGYVPDI